MKENRILKRFLALLLSAAMLVTYMPSSVYALDDESDDTSEVEVAANNGDSGGEVKKESSPKEAPEAAPPAKADPPANDNEQKVEDVKEEQKEQEVTENPSGTDPPASEGEKAEDSKDPADQGEEAKAEALRADGENVITEEAKAEGDAADEAEAEDAITEEDEKEDEKDEVEEITIYFDPTIDDQLELIPVKVNKGEAIGSKLPTVPSVPGYKTKWVMKNDHDTEVDKDTVVNNSFTAVIGKDKIEYTVTFIQENGDRETRTANIDNGFAINDLPDVTPVTNKVGKWVYQGTTKEFTVGTVVSENLTVVASYVQNIFNVKYMVDGALYDELTTATGAKIILPTTPVKSGATFKGWFTQENGQGKQYTADDTVDQDLTLYAYFEDQVRVHFLVKDDNGHVISDKSQYFIDLEAGEEIKTMPEDPFIEGKVFVRWENENNGDTVTKGYTVEESFNAVAVFAAIQPYELTVEYFYKNDAGNRVDIGSQVFDIVEKDFPYTVTAPEYTIAAEVSGKPTYYPSQATITVTKADFNGAYELVINDEFVAANVDYKVGHYLKNADGEGYELYETIDKKGVLNSKVTPEINSYAFAEFEKRDQNVALTGEAGQELKVYYTRKDFTLSYNVAGGDYIDAQTAPYGTTITLPTNATRTGYTFAGWYKDAECEQPAGTSYKLEANTTLYAKWNPAQSDYKIVYMIENANDDGYSYLATVTKQAPTGSSITMTAQTAGANGTRPSDLDTTNFTFKDSTTEVVKADGTTAVIVRYSRNVYTITWNGEGYARNGGRWQTGQGTASLSAKYGADISAQWTATFNTPHPDWAWNFSRTNNDEKFTSLDIMPSGNKTVYNWYYSTTKTQTLNYWFENYDSATTKNYGGRTYGLFKAVTVHYNYLYDTDYPDYAGYTKGGWVRSDGARSLTASTPNGAMTADFYYNAKQYPLSFYNYDGTLISTQQVTLNADISNYLTSNVPATPMEGAEWQGWFTDAEHSEPYGGGTKMPTGLVLYGDFEFPTRTVTFDSQGGSEVAPQTDEYGFYAETPADPTKENYIFQGWFTKADETGSPYDWNQPVEKNITLYAHWAQKTLSYTVHYYQQGTTTSVLPDKVVSDPAFTEGTEVTETAPVVANYVSDNASVTKALSFDESENVITFYYVNTPETLTYEVNYVLKSDHGIKVAESKKVTVPGTTTNALEMAVEVDKAYLATQTQDQDILGMNYRPTEETKEIQLAVEGNVITFEYVPFNTAKITVNYLDMDGNPIDNARTSYVEQGDTFTVQNMAPNGFVYHHAYLAGTTEAPKAVYQINGDEGTIVINAYYQRKLIIIAKNKSKSYDGEALFSSGLDDATITGYARGDKVTSVEFEGSQTEAGTSSTTPKNAQITMGSEAITHPDEYYSIIYVPGSLTVKAVSVYINIAADQWNTHSGGTGPNYYTGQEFKVGFTNPSKQHFNDGEGTAYVSITSSQRDKFKAKYGNAIWSALYGKDGALISEKDAGTYTVTGAEQRAKVAAVEVDGTEMMSDPNYSITLFARDSFLTITPLPLTITTGTATKPYDGTALTKTDNAALDHSFWTANIGGSWTAAATARPGSVTLGTGDTIEFKVIGTQTEVGSSENKYEIEWGNVKSSNYAVTATTGTLNVTENGGKVVLTAATDSKTYDGTALTNSEVTASGLPEGFKVEATASGSQTDAGESANVVAEGFKILDKNNEDKTDNFTNVQTVDGTLTVNPKAVTITTGSASKAYDGKALTKDEASIEGLIAADKAVVEVKATGSQTEVGSSTNSYSIEWGTAKAANYDVTENLGTLTVTSNDADVVLTAASGSKTYDGKALTNAEVTATGLPEGFTYEASASGSQTDAGSSANVVNDGYKFFDKDGNDKTSNFTKVEKVDGTLTVNPKAVTITTGSDSKAYDGKALTKDEASIEGLIADDEKVVEVKATGSQTEVGSSKNTYSITWGTAKAANYAITENLGTLTVTKNAGEVTLTAASDSKTYDGKALENNHVTASGLPEGFRFEATASGSQTDAGESANVVEDGYKIFDKDGNDQTANFTNIKTADGILTVNPKAVTIKTGTDSKEYDGTALTKDEASIEGLIAADKEVVEVKATGSQTEVGSSSNTYSIKWGTAKADNYTVTETLGTLTVTPNETAKVRLTAASDSKLYDGTALTNANVTASGLPEGFTIEATASGSQTDAGESANVVDEGFKILDKNGDDKTANFTDVQTVDGTLTVSKRKVTLTSGDGEKVYDGTALTNSEVKVSGDGFAQGEGATFNVTGSQTEVGSSKNTFSYQLNEGTDGSNYEITKAEGTLKVTELTDKVTVTITENSGSEKYDGTQKKVEGYTVSISNPLYTEADFTFSGSDVVEGTDAGKYEMNLKPEDFRNNNKNFSNVEFVIVDGALEISKREVTLTSATDEKEYDGTALTNNVVTVSGDGFAQGEGAAYDVTGTQTVVGSSNNTFTYTLNEGTKADNYTITKAEGTLTVTTRGAKYKITVKANSETATYDGKNHSAKGVETLTFEVEGNTYRVSGLTTEDPEEKNAGTYTNNINGTPVVRDAAGNDVSSEFSVSTENGQLVIDKRKVTLTSADGKKVYDGTPLTKNEQSDITVSGDGFIEGILGIGGEGATYEITGSQTLVGSSKNAFTYTLKDNTLEDNYEIVTVFGTLTVTDGTNPDDPEPVDDGLVVTKTAEDKAYALGEVVTFTITATNIYADEREIILEEIPGVMLAEASKTVAGGGKFITTATYTITEADILKGSFTNTVTAKVGKLAKKASATVNTEDLDTTLTVNKKISNKPADGKAYKLGETIEYTITFKNDGNVTYKNVKVEDKDTGLSETIDSLAVGETKTFVTSHKVDEADILAGSYTNTVTAKGDPINDQVPEGEDSVTTGDEKDPDGPNPPIEDLDTTLTVNKMISNKPADGKAYKLGETIEYTITVKNDGNATYKNVKVEDKDTGLSETIDSLAVGETKTFKTSHVVDEADILAGSYTNTVTAKADPINGQTPEGEDSVTTGDEDDPDGPNPPIEDLDTTLTVNKKISNKPADGKAYKLGETIEYTITVKNDGNATYKNVKVEDKDTGLSETIAVLEVGETKTFKTSHVVDEADILAGSYTNTVTAKADPINDQVPEGEDSVTTGDEDDPDGPNPPIEDLDTTLTVNKTISNKPADGKAYKLGETIEYTITVKNDGNATYKNVKVDDENTGLSETIAVLEIGETKTFKTSHVVDEADVLAGSYTNTVIAKGDPIGDKVPEGEDTVTTGDEDDPDGPNPPVDPKNGHLTLKKETTSKAARADGKYVLNETISYRITATNDGNLTLTDVKVVDELTNEEWTVASLAPGESREFTTQYVVKEADLIAGEVVNVATATVKSPDDDKPNPPVVPGVDPEPTEGSKPGLTVTKTASRTSGVRRGNVVTYTITIENTGNVTLSGVSVADTLVKFAENSGQLGTMAPGAKATITYDYTVTAANVRAGKVDNTAAATGTTPDGKDVSGEDTVTVATRGNGGGGNNPGGDNPNPRGGGNPTPAPGGPGITPATPDDGDATVIPDEPVPEVEPEVDIVDPEVPLAAGAWALVNLISAIVTALGAAVALFRKKEDDDEEKDDQEGEKKAKDKEEEEEEDDNRGKKMLAAKIAGAVAGIAAPITFILTEDMSLPMQMIDKWTLLMLIMLAAQIVAAVLNKKASKLDDDEEEENAEAAAN